MAQPEDLTSLHGFAVTVDVVVLSVSDGLLQAMLVRRDRPPHSGRLALPGGFARADEGLDDAAARVLHDVAGISRHQAHLEQLRTYGTPDRDPRGRVVSVAWLAVGADLPSAASGGSDGGRQWAPVAMLSGEAADLLAFDHGVILADGVERARAKLEYTPLAMQLLPDEFTVAQLREVYETVWGARLDPANFHRKVTGAAGFVEPTGERAWGTRGRPAALFRAGTTSQLYPPVLRPSADG